MRLLHGYILRKNTGGFALGILLIIVATLTAMAQSGAAVVRGTVTDQQGKAIAGATVTLTSVDKNLSRAQTTNEEGIYVFSSIAPGNYRIDVEAASFKKTSVSNVTAQVDTQRNIDIQLEIGSVTEVSNITAAAEAPINTTDATLGNTFESRRIENLPLNARNIVGLLSLQPGVTRLGEVNGARRDQANITLDGVDANEQQTGLDVVAASVNANENDANKVREAFSSVLTDQPRRRAGVPRHHFGRQRDAGPFLGRPGLAHHQIGKQSIPRLALRIPPQHDHDGQRLVQQRQRPLRGHRRPRGSRPGPSRR